MTMREATEKSLRGSSFRLAALLLAALALAGACGRRQPPGEAVKEAGSAAAATPLQQRAPTNAQEMALQRAQDEAYNARLQQTAEERNSKARRLADIRRKMAVIEVAATNSPAMDLLQREIADLRRALAEKEEALATAAPYRKDPAWQQLEAEARQAQQEVDTAQAEVQRAVSERLRAQYDAMRRERTAASGARPVLPVLPMPERPPENTNRAHRLTSEMVGARKLVVPPRPGQGRLAATNMAPARPVAPPVTVIPGQAD